MRIDHVPDEIREKIDREVKKRMDQFEKDIVLLRSLMDKFGIEQGENTSYIKLAIVLARKLYPNGVRNVGRPKKRSILDFFEQTTKRGRGRPAKRKELRRNLVKAVEYIKKKHDLNGRGSDKKALEIILDQLSKETKRSKLRLRGEYLSRWQKDLSRGRSELIAKK